MGADLYESYLASILAAAALGVSTVVSAGGTSAEQLKYIAAPVMLAGLGVLVSIGGVFMVRANEDATMSTKKAQINTQVYSMELLGEASMVTMNAAGSLVSVKAAKDYRAEIGSDVSANVAPDICHIFDQKTGERIDD